MELLTECVFACGDFEATAVDSEIESKEFPSLVKRKGMENEWRITNGNITAVELLIRLSLYAKTHIVLTYKRVTTLKCGTHFVTVELQPHCASLGPFQIAKAAVRVKSFV